MADNDKAPSAALPLMAGFVLLLVAVIVAAVTGISHGSIGGAVIAIFGVIPGAYAAWVGIQNKDSQANLLFGILIVLASVALAGLLILLRFVSWLR